MKRSGQKRGEISFRPDISRVLKHPQHVLTAHDSVLSSLGHEHRDSDCTSVHRHVSGGLPSLLSEP